MTDTTRKLIAVYCRTEGSKRLLLRYRGRMFWEYVDVYSPQTIGRALQVALERIEEAVPGTLAKAAAQDDKDFMANNRRKRRYIAKEREVLYIESEHLQPESEQIAGHWVVTNIAWPKVDEILRLVCAAANVKYGAAEVKV